MEEEKKEKRKYSQLTEKQRYAIYLGIARKQTYKEIAGEIGVHPSTVHREVKRNQKKGKHYVWLTAQQQAMERRKRTTQNRKIEVQLLLQVKDLIIEKQWSPKQISGVLKKEGKHISHEKIYQIIREDTTGTLAANCRHKMKYHKTKRKKNKEIKPLIKNRTSIHERPIPEDNNWMGFWEMDLIVGKKGKGVIITLMEKSTNYLLMEHLKNGKDATSIAYVVRRLLIPFQGEWLKSITTDNGLEFAKHELITSLLNGITVYFADPYCSWQKGAIENTNKLIRQYLPKGTDFDTISDKKIRDIQYKINHRPRQKLNFLTPAYCFLKNFA